MRNVSRCDNILSETLSLSTDRFALFFAVERYHSAPRLHYTLLGSFRFSFRFSLSLSRFASELTRRPKDRIGEENRRKNE